MSPLHRRKHPIVRRLARLVTAAHHWCFAPVAGAVRGQVNGSEWARVAVVALVPVFFEVTAAHATEIFRDPWVATAINGALLALASRCHRAHDGP